MCEEIDVLNRNEFICKLVSIVEMLSENKQSVCFGVDGIWGSGKTFVLNKFEKEIRTIKLKESNCDKYFNFHYDCWKYDYYDEPLIAIVSAMIDGIDRELNKIPEEIRAKGGLAIQTAKDTILKIAGEICKNKIGIDWVEVAGETLENYDKKNESKFDQFYSFNKVLEEVRNGIQEIAKDKTMIFVVDELDRCLPEYAIKVLERLHHVFVDIENVIVIISVDKMQLEHSIKGIYGSEVDVDKYLRKFISFMIKLDNGKSNDFASKYCSYFEMFDVLESEKTDIEEFLADILMDVDMRTQERIFRKAEIIHKLIRNEKNAKSSFLCFEILYITVSLLCKSSNIEWVGKIWLSENLDAKDAVGEKYYNMLREYGEIIENTAVMNSNLGGKMKEYKIINKSIVHQAFFLINSMYTSYYNGVCDPYYCLGVESEVELVNNFKSISDVINCD